MSQETRFLPHSLQGARPSTSIPRAYHPPSIPQNRTPSTQDQQRGTAAPNTSRDHAVADLGYAQPKVLNQEAAEQGQNMTYYVPTGERTGGIAGGANTTSDVAQEGKDKGSIWERIAARVGGHDGEPRSKSRGSEPLPSWLRDP
ncbi:hypothetical protein F5B17DRAFT_435809 [Nemania serpens]|nr:hypothetical protein F5B17DRAFT_435809 [Nemania serpens]